MGTTPPGPGTVLAGRFVLEDLLDEDDAARLWRATDRVLARDVAVNVLPESDPRSPALLTAARTSALVSDPRLLRVLDAASGDGVVYVVNEWGAGVSLDRLLVDGTLEPRRAARVVRDVAEAIATAHRNGVAHGRLLPENVMVTEAGSVKVIGFVVSSALRDSPGQLRRRVTGGDPLDAFEADVVDLGALLYAALVGRWPGTEGSAVPVAPHEHGRPLRPRQVRAGVPRPLDAICERVLHDEPDGHAPPLTSAHEVYAALSDFIGDTLPPGASLAATDADGDHGAAGGAEATTVLGRGEPGPAADPEATQAGAPVFDDDTAEGAAAPIPPPVLPPVLPPVPPPVLPPGPPGRPLFADEPRSGPSGSTAAPDSSAAYEEPVRAPAHEPAAEPTDPARQDGPVPGRSWLRLAAGVAVLVLVAVGALFALGLVDGPGGDRSGATSPASPASRTSAATPVRIAGVTDFDPEADPPRENPELARLAVDGKPATSWHTSTYFDQFPTLKSGVGLLVDLGRPARVGRVTVTLRDRPTTVRLLAAPGASAAPTSTDGLTRVASKAGAGTTAVLAPAKPVRTRWLVVWLTSLPHVSGGYRGTVSEISVRS